MSSASSSNRRSLPISLMRSERSCAPSRSSKAHELRTPCIKREASDPEKRGTRERRQQLKRLLLDANTR
jgi:hypothetical protein